MDTKPLRNELGKRLLKIVKTEEELSPSMVSSVVNFLKAFPPSDTIDELPVATRISETLEKYRSNAMPFKN